MSPGEQQPLRVLRLQTPSFPSIQALKIEGYAPHDALSGVAASEGGVGLATALLVEAASSGSSSDRVPLALAVGSALVRGLPTAARLSLVTRGLMRDGCVDGQVGGGDLARRLASICDGLLLTGPERAAPEEPLCLHLYAGGAEYLRLPSIDQASPREALRYLGEQFGEGAALVLGPQCTADFAYSGLTAGEIGRGPKSPTSFLGRGGVGARFAALGLRALVFTSPVHVGEGLLSEDRKRSSEKFAQALRASPRLAARAKGGTLELLDLHARAAELGGGAPATKWAENIAAEARESQTGRHGCKGCPTPCGLVFDRTQKVPGAKDGGAQGARFGALHAVTARLGLDRFGEGLALLEQCDDLGLDAKEAGLALFVMQTAALRGIVDLRLPRGDVVAIKGLLDAVVCGESPWTAEFKLGADVLAARLGLEGEIHEARGELLGASLSAESASVMIRGADSGRFAGAAEDLEALQRFPEVAWSLGGKAAIEDEAGASALALCLQEDWIATTDALGICSFSCRALLEDGMSTTTDLGRVLLRSPRSEAGEQWLALGAAVCELQARLRSAKPVSRGEPTRFEEVYGALREERSSMEPTQVLRERLARVRRVASREESAPIETHSRVPGTVHLRCFGALAEALGTENFALTLDLPAPLEQVLHGLAQACPKARALLFSPGGSILPATHRGGTRLSRDSSVTKGEKLDLVLALRGG